MASLADELDFDPAFDDGHLNNNHGSSPSYDEEVGGSSSVEQSPVRVRGGRGTRGGRRGVRKSYSSDEQEQHGASQQSLGEAFSLADELGGGSNERATIVVTSLAEEVKDVEGSGSERSPRKGLDMDDDDARARRNREYYLTSSESLNSSLTATEAFLTKLKQSSAAPGFVENGRVMPSVGSSSSFLGSGAPNEDLSTLEAKAGQVLKQMREHSNTREDQIRELQECDRLLRRALEEGGDWIGALANVDGLEDEEASSDETDARDVSLGFISNSYARRSSTMMNGANAGDILEDEEGHVSVDSSTSLTRLPLSSIAVNGQQRERSETSDPTICQELASLQHNTLDLVASLGSIHEQSQVSRASMNDAARRIKTIKNVLSNWNAEIEEAEQSRSHILSWESAGTDSASRPRDIREWTENHIERFQRVLNDASIKAAELLRPVQDNFLDRSVAQA